MSLGCVIRGPLGQAKSTKIVVFAGATREKRVVYRLLSIMNHVNQPWHAPGRSRPSSTLWPIRKTPPELPDSPPQSRRGRSSMPSGWGHGGQIQGSETWGMPLGTSFPSQSSIHLRVVTASGQPTSGVVGIKPEDSDESDKGGMTQENTKRSRMWLG